MKAEKKRILEMVEQGKLTAAEALTLLEQLDLSAEKQTIKQEEILHELSTDVSYNDKKDEGKGTKDDSFNQKVLLAKDKLFDFVDSALNKIKDFDLDLNFGSYIGVSHIFQDSDTSFNALAADLANGDIEIITWENNEVRVECEAKVYRVKDQREAKSLFLKETIFSIDDGILQFTNSQKTMKVTAKMFIPDGLYEKMKIRLFNGSAFGEKLQAKEIKAKTANGKIQLDKIVGTEAEFETANGQITVNASQFQRIEAETINGPINVNGSFDKVFLQSFNGHVQCRIDNKNCESIRAKAVTGSVDISLPAGASVDGDLKTNLGGFNINLGGIDVVEEKNEVAKKSLRFKAGSQSEKKILVFGESMSGSISINSGNL